MNYMNKINCDFNRIVTNLSKIKGPYIIILFTKTLVTREVLKKIEKRQKQDLDWLYCHAAQILLGRRECRWTRLPSHIKTLLHTWRCAEGSPGTSAGRGHNTSVMDSISHWASFKRFYFKFLGLWICNRWAFGKWPCSQSHQPQLRDYWILIRVVRVHIAACVNIMSRKSPSAFPRFPRFIY